jgi:hypothetical protein
MNSTIEQPCGDFQPRAQDGVRPVFRANGVISVHVPRPAKGAADACGLVSHGHGDALGEWREQERARDLASAAEMAELPEWVLRERERGRRAGAELAREQREELARAEQRAATMRESLERINKLRREDEDRSFAGFADPATANSNAEELAREEAEWRAVAAHALAAVRGDLGQWSPDSETRCEQTTPATMEEERDAKRLGRRGWALSRLGTNGGLRDLAYVVEQIRLEVGDAVLGCWVADAMGLARDGRSARRQLHSQKARRKLFRSYVLWRCGSYGPLSDFAGSPSSRRVRGVKRCPQRLLARVLAVGGKPWSRATTTRDASEAHKTGLCRRIRLPADVAPEEERAGASGQVVSRYVFELPSLRLPRRRPDRMVQLAGALSASCSQPEWSAEWVAQHAVRFAMTSCDMGGLGAARAAAPPTAC